MAGDRGHRGRHWAGDRARALREALDSPTAMGVIICFVCTDERVAELGLRGRESSDNRDIMAIPPPHPQIPQVPDTPRSKFGRHSNELGCLGLSLLILVLVAILIVVIFFL